MDDIELELKVKHFLNKLDEIIMECETGEELTVLATVMAAYARRGLGISFGSQESADAMLFDSLNALSPATPKMAV